MKRFILFLFVVAGVPGVAWSQAPATTDQMVAVDPIRCWWRTSTGAVRIGETFDLSMTCAVLENDMVQVVPDESRLAGAVISMAPFEIVASSHPEDLKQGQRRFFQYQYTLRIINPDAIGTDVGIPIISLHYRVNSKIAANASLQGRDLTYVLPQQGVKVLSLVTADAPDIRDSSNESFSSVEAIRLRAGVLDVSAITLAALGVLMIIAILIRSLRGIRKGVASGERLMGEHAVLRQASRELAAVQRESDQGWNEGLIGRALAATRIAAAAALGRRASQRPANTSTQAGAGRVMARPLFGRGATTALSSSATSEDVARALARLPESADPAHRQSLEGLQTALTTFGQAQYGRDATADRTTLDAALAAATAATSRLKSLEMWPKPSLRRWSRATPQPEHQT